MRRRRLFGDERVGFLLILPPFGMAENDVAHGKFLQHSGANFAGKGAEIIFAHVLRAEADVGIVDDGLGHRFQGGEGRAHHDVHLADVGQFQFQVAHQSERFGHRLVHLPVAGNDQFSFFIHILIILVPVLVLENPITRTRRRTKWKFLLFCQRRHTRQNRAFQKFQARASAGAHKRHLVAQSAFFSAFTLSPPPMMLLAPFCVASATACATMLVLAAKRGSSNMPSGPFHKIVLAPLMISA